MKKIDALYNLMIDYKKILEISESKKDLKLLNDFINLLDGHRDMPYSEFIKNLSVASETKYMKPNTKNSIKNIKYNIDTIVLIYKNSIITNNQLTKDDVQLFEEFNYRYPNIKNIILLESSELYKQIHSTPLENFTLIELQFLLKFYFNTKTSSKNTKKDLYEKLLNNIYQSNYLDSLNINYSKTNGI